MIDCDGTGILIVAFDVSVILIEKQLEAMNPLAIFFVAILGVLIVTSLYALSRQPQSTTNYSFKVPLVPLTPMVSVLINAYLMMKLPIPTWQRFGIWMTIGFFIYFTYGIRNSTGFMTDHQKKNHMSLLKNSNDNNTSNRSPKSVQDVNTVSEHVIIN